MVGIKMPPEKQFITYPAPKAEGGKDRRGQILARAYCIEKHLNSGKFVYYCRILDLVKWHFKSHIDHKELRFTYYYFKNRCEGKPKTNQKGWVYGQGAGHMKPGTFMKLIKKAKTNPDYKNFGKILDRVYIKS